MTITTMSSNVIGLYPSPVSPGARPRTTQMASGTRSPNRATSSDNRPISAILKIAAQLAFALVLTLAFTLAAAGQHGAVRSPVWRLP